jgi:hypothetical protein
MIFAFGETKRLLPGTDLDACDRFTHVLLADPGDRLDGADPGGLPPRDYTEVRNASSPCADEFG